MTDKDLDEFIESLAGCVAYAAIMVYFIGLIPPILADAISNVTLSFVAVGVASFILPLILSPVISSFLKEEWDDEYRGILESPLYTGLIIIIALFFIWISKDMFDNPAFTLVMTVVSIVATHLQIIPRIKDALTDRFG